MTSRRVWILLIIVVVLILIRPSQVWKETKRTWAQRDLILRILVSLIGLYLIYGLYSLYSKGWPVP